MPMHEIQVSQKFAALSSSYMQAQVAGMVDVGNTIVFRLHPTLSVVIFVPAITMKTIGKRTITDMSHTPPDIFMAGHNSSCHF